MKFTSGCAIAGFPNNKVRIEKPKKCWIQNALAEKSIFTIVRIMN